jgi:hypothetical protein
MLYPHYIKHRRGSGISMEVLREHLIRDGSLKTTPWLIPTLEELDAWWTSENDRRSRPVVAIGSFVRVTPVVVVVVPGSGGPWQQGTVRQRAPLGKHEHRGACRC